MKANAAKTRKIKNLWRNNLRDKGEDRKIRIECGKLLADLGCFERFMLMHWNVELECPLFHRVEFSAWRIRWTEHGKDFFSFARELLECLFSKRGLTNQNNTHGRFPLLYSFMLVLSE